jgi:hypothetical protein
MSWSYSGVGKPAAVIANARKALTTYKCSEPEETIKMGVLEIIETSLNAYPADFPVAVSASGSQSQIIDGFVNNLTVKIDPLWGFLHS